MSRNGKEGEVVVQDEGRQSGVVFQRCCSNCFASLQVSEKTCMHNHSGGACDGATVIEASLMEASELIDTTTPHLVQENPTAFYGNVGCAIQHPHSGKGL